MKNISQIKTQGRYAKKKFKHETIKSIIYALLRSKGLYCLIIFLSICSCKTSNVSSLAYMNNYIKKNVSETCINVKSSYMYYEYTDTLTNKDYALSVDRDGHINVKDNSFKYTRIR